MYKIFTQPGSTASHNNVSILEGTIVDSALDIDRAARRHLNRRLYPDDYISVSDISNVR
jgi:hypothetical protein